MCVCVCVYVYMYENGEVMIKPLLRREGDGANLQA